MARKSTSDGATFAVLIYLETHLSPTDAERVSLAGQVIVVPASQVLQREHLSPPQLSQTSFADVVADDSHETAEDECAIELQLTRAA
jgi:hypothetical protein